MAKVLVHLGSIVLLANIITSTGGNGSQHFDAIKCDTEMSIYYDLKTNSRLKIESAADESRISSNRQKLIARGLPCSCTNLKCGCCAGVNITALSFDRRACTNVTIVPEQFALDFDVTINDEPVFTSTVSARNPPPACVPLYFFPVVTFCVRLFDLHLADNKLNACVDFETRVGQWPIFVLHFNCVKLGTNGATWSRPDDAVPDVANVTYDDVDFESADENPPWGSTSTLSPDEEDAIGTLKLS